MEPATIGDPMRPLLWVSKSLDKLAAALNKMGHAVSANTVRKLLTEHGFSRQSNRKADEGSHHVDRDAQFEHINAKVRAAQAAASPQYRLAPKRRNWLAISATAAAITVPKASRCA